MQVVTLVTLIIPQSVLYAQQDGSSILQVTCALKTVLSHSLVILQLEYVKPVDLAVRLVQAILSVLCV